MKCLFPGFLVRVLSLAIILLTANTSVWAAQVVMEVTHDPDKSLSAQIYHESGWDAGANQDTELQGIGCDHSCHAGAHMLALSCVEQTPMVMSRPTLASSLTFSLLESPADPPFIPPIA